jgi:acyl-CoA thioesterase-2
VLNVARVVTLTPRRLCRFEREIGGFGRERLSRVPATLLPCGVPFDLANLVACLSLRPADGGRLDADNLALDYRRVFGGQLLAQTVMALREHADGKSLKSLVQQFPREGDVELPVTYDVDVRHSGRTFATVGVTLTQAEKLISVAAASLHMPESGLESAPLSPVVGTPEDAVPVVIDMIPWEIRVVDGVDLNVSEGGREPAFQWWMRLPADAQVEDSDWTHQALLAHSTDLTVIGTALLPVDGLSQADTGRAFHSAVTTHSLWFHQPFRLTDWVLVDQVAPVLSGGRVWGRGDVWQDGRLVASFAQESMVRMLA